MRISDWSSDVCSSDLADLEAQGLLELVKPHKLMVPRGDRTNVVIEPLLTDQWFVAMSKPAPEGTFNPGKSIAEETGRASCRGRECPYVKIPVVAVPLTTNKSKALHTSYRVIIV